MIQTASHPVHRVRTSCRGCGGNGLRRFLSLGPTPLANAFVHSNEFARESRFPLDVYHCPDCSLVQLVDVIDPSVLFRNYLYVTGTSETMAAHNAEYAATVVSLLELSGADLVIEIASNDGSLLKCFQPYGVRPLGVEPAINLARAARTAGVPTVNEFFDLQTARAMRTTYGPAKAVLANNVLAHVDSPQDFLSGCRHLLVYDGLLMVEVPYIGDLLERFEYDTIYHEHLCYFSVQALMNLCESVGLSIIRIDHVPVHGGSVRIYAGKTTYFGRHAAMVQQMAEREVRDGVSAFPRYLQLAEDVEHHRQLLLELLNRLKQEGKSIAAYGAPAKGNTLLNFCGIGTDVIDFTVDRNPLKVGSFTPGTHIPVLPVDAVLERQPDYMLILAWNFADEIMAQQAEYQRRGGSFIVPFPEPTIIAS